MSDLPEALSALESIDISSRETQIDRRAIFFPAPVNGEKVALAVSDVAFDFNQLVGDVMTGVFIPGQRRYRPWNEISGPALEQSVIVGRVGVIDAMEQLRV